MADKKDYNLTVARMYTTKSGNVRSLRIMDDELEALQSVEKGGMLLLKFVPEDRRKNDKSPHAYLEYVKPADVDTFFGDNGGAKPPRATTGYRPGRVDSENGDSL